MKDLSKEQKAEFVGLFSELSRHLNIRSVVMSQIILPVLVCMTFSFSVWLWWSKTCSSRMTTCWSCFAKMPPINWFGTFTGMYVMPYTIKVFALECFLHYCSDPSAVRTFASFYFPGQAAFFKKAFQDTLFHRVTDHYNYSAGSYLEATQVTHEFPIRNFLFLPGAAASAAADTSPIWQGKERAKLYGP